MCVVWAMVYLEQRKVSRYDRILLSHGIGFKTFHSFITLLSATIVTGIRYLCIYAIFMPVKFFKNNFIGHISKLS